VARVYRNLRPLVSQTYRQGVRDREERDVAELDAHFLRPQRSQLHAHPSLSDTDTRHVHMVRVFLYTQCAVSSHPPTIITHVFSMGGPGQRQPPTIITHRVNPRQ
jgi:hypothetical protein